MLVNPQNISRNGEAHTSRISRHGAKPATDNYVYRIALVFVILGTGWALINTPNLPHAHEDHSTLFGDSCMSDPCHVSIYHHGSGEACHHKYHLSAGEDDCPRCHVIPIRQIAPEYVSLVAWLTEKADRTFTSIEMQAWTRCIEQGDRGPPALS